ncbi:tRNA (pseudouridine(54)-N(1))-methyltransferase TrmY [Vibrio sp. S4M6]|uniref:tRNA (pseudouridine(54)-N(1))-methyltransferase TrmY n=1 Tax=Vibrio sinus TaxID=2946865 RepID=UPI00202A2A77|nr:tRNA (pseudouridine(54)-N(1))-methyltransferase TrmY [Vibrio sinus]MCL9781189.1 tRNA (pseudouridine(54)-N(1))-methyltransferase TrmY [Vibrio sinus]
MRAFVVRARAASTNKDTFLSSVGEDAHVEILAHVLMNAVFTAQSHRNDVEVYLVLESTQDFSRTIHFQSEQLVDIGGFHEQALINKIAFALEKSTGMGKEHLRIVEPGINVETTSFEKLVQRLSEQYQLYLLDKKGSDVREVNLSENSCFLLTDHIPMPKKSWNSLKRLNTEKISLGPKMLFASQCITLINNELDIQGL